MAEITNTANIAKNRITRERYIQDCEKVNPGQNHMSLIVDKGPVFSAKRQPSKTRITAAKDVTA